MKKLIIVLMLIATVFSLTACGVDPSQIDRQQIQEGVNSFYEENEDLYYSKDKEYEDLGDMIQDILGDALCIITGRDRENIQEMMDNSNKQDFLTAEDIINAGKANKEKNRLEQEQKQQEEVE